MFERLLADIPTLEHAPAIAYAMAFVVALIDGLAVFGLLIPGGAFIIGLGALAANGYLSLTSLVWFAAAGAILGDGMSFYLGQRSRRTVHSIRVLTPARIGRAEALFARFGTASILFARFVSPLRPILPFVAGVAKMPARCFYTVNVVSAFAWAITFLGVGFFLGSA